MRFFFKVSFLFYLLISDLYKIEIFILERDSALYLILITCRCLSTTMKTVQSTIISTQIKLRENIIEYTRNIILYTENII